MACAAQAVTMRNSLQTKSNHRAGYRSLFRNSTPRRRFNAVLSSLKTQVSTTFTPSKLTKVVIPDADAEDDIERTVTADICFPKDDQGNPAAPRGVVVFMHGFSQLPKSYDTTIKQIVEDGFMVLAPYGGREAVVGDASIFSPKVQKNLRELEKTSKRSSPRNPIAWIQSLQSNLKYSTQLALKQDGLLCINYVTGNPSKVLLTMPDGSKQPLSTYLPRPVKKVAVSGHSMGGGLCFSLAAERPAVSAIGVMAPMCLLEPEFDPVTLAQTDPDLSNKKIEILSGAWDFLARPKDIEKLVDALVLSGRKNEVTYKKLPQYWHTSFEDELTLGDASLTALVTGVLVAVSLLVHSSLGDDTLLEDILKIVAGILWAGYIYLALIRPKFQQGSDSREMIVKFFEENTPRA